MAEQKPKKQKLEKPPKTQSAKLWAKNAFEAPVSVFRQWVLKWAEWEAKRYGKVKSVHVRRRADGKALIAKVFWLSGHVTLVRAELYNTGYFEEFETKGYSSWDDVEVE